MHPKISEFPSREFYSGKLDNGITELDRPCPIGFPWPKDGQPICFIDVDSKEAKTKEILIKSEYNEKEAMVVDKVIQLVLQGELKPKQIGIITPYNGQVRLLQQRYEDSIPELTISTIDGFQGREKELIIFSTVRANTEGRVGFLADWKRLNVALTRARRGLIVVGNAKTLINNERWKRWLDWIIENGFLLKYEENEYLFNLISTQNMETINEKKTESRTKRKLPDDNDNQQNIDGTHETRYTVITNDTTPTTINTNDILTKKHKIEEKHYIVIDSEDEEEKSTITNDNAI